MSNITERKIALIRRAVALTDPELALEMIADVVNVRGNIPHAQLAGCENRIALCEHTEKIDAMLEKMIQDIIRDTRCDRGTAIRAARKTADWRARDTGTDLATVLSWLDAHEDA